MRIPLTIASFVILTFASFKQHCHEDIEKGHKVLVHATDNIIKDAFHRRNVKMQKVVEETKKKRINPVHSALREEWKQYDDKECPSPMPTIFPPPPTYIPTTTTVSTPAHTVTTTATQPISQTSASTAARTVPSENPTTTPTTVSTSASTADSPTRIEDIKYSYFAADPEGDVHNQFARKMQHYLQPENDVCDGPKFKDLNSINEEQLFGFLSSLATNHPGPFCNLCDRLLTEIKDKILTPNPLLLKPDEVYLRKLLNAYLPDPHLICSALAPGCYTKYQDRAAKRNITTAVVCLECTMCQSVTNVLMHKVLLNKPVLAALEKWMSDNIFFNFCAELCSSPMLDPLEQLFNVTFTMKGCVRFLDREMQFVVRAMKNILKPERFCTLELGWCELNEVPNIIHCLRELCEEALGQTPAFNWLCSQIPDRPDAADAYLNVQKMKIYKEMKDYHYAYLAKDEL